MQNEMTEETFAIRLLRAKAKAGLTQAELADAMGTRRSTICQLEQGKTLPNYTTLVGLAKALDVSTDYLCMLKDTP